MKTQKGKFYSVFILFIGLLLATITGCSKSSTSPPPVVEDPGDDVTFVSHEKYFTDNAYEGTVSCLGSECHSQQAQDVLETGHWKWEGAAENVVNATDGLPHGKNDFINNFCIAIPSNEGRCSQCHIGYGYVDRDFDFTDETKIDCLSCHDQTGTYKKAATNGGLPDPMVDLLAVAKSVGDNEGVPTRNNCIFCHANAGGGDNVKHGDLSMSIANTTREFDVHMGTDGANLSCVDCHDVERNVAGDVVSHGIGGMPFHSVGEGSMKQCADCHENPDTLHAGVPDVQDMVVTHERLACQTCHIPSFARNTSTKMEWYWSDAGQDIDPIPVDPATGRPTYDKKKGSFVWANNVRPTLRFHNGKWNKVMLGLNDTASSEPVDLASPAASRADTDAKVYPFKKMVGNQVADANNGTVLVPHLFKGSDAMPNPYWGVYDWDLALWDAISYPTGQTYTGDYKFVNTQMLLSVNHEIAPKEQALGMGARCRDCHLEGQIDWPALGYDEDPHNDGGNNPN